MNDSFVKITTRRWIIVSLLGCILGCGCLAAIGRRNFGKAPPEILFLTVVIALLTGWKTLWINREEMYVYYNLLFFKRRISVSRITSIVIAIKNEEYQMLFVIDNCPPLRSENTNWLDFYALRHPIRVISIQCNKNDAIACEQCLRAKQIPIKYIRKINTRNNRL